MFWCTCSFTPLAIKTAFSVSVSISSSLMAFVIYFKLRCFLNWSNPWWMSLMLLHYWFCLISNAWSFSLLLLLPVCIGSMLVWMLCELLILVDVEMYSSCCCPIVCSSVGWWDNLWYYLSLFEPTTVVPYSVWMPMIIFRWPAPRTLVCNFLLISPLVLMLQITVGGCHYGWCLLDCFLSLTCGICGCVYYDLFSFYLGSLLVCLFCLCLQIFVNFS